MWKLLRIGAVLALVAVGALKLSQTIAAHAQLDRLAAELAPALRLSFSGTSATLDGRVSLDQPRLEVVRGPAAGSVLAAERATIGQNDAFWLLKRALTGASGAPDDLEIHLDHASLTQPFLDRLAREGWFGATSLVPFETLGCGEETTFSPRDFARMGLSIAPREEDIRYRYDAAGRALKLDVASTAAPFATITTHLELSHFVPSAWLGDASALAAERIEQFSLVYADGGYLARRNRFCAQLTGVDAAVFAGRHAAAVESFLAARGVVPGSETAALYRRLVEGGGSAEISSLPDASFAPADIAAYAPDDVLRLLNVTLRRNTAPPILLRLAFTAPTTPDADASLAEGTEPATGPESSADPAAMAAAEEIHPVPAPTPTPVKAETGDDVTLMSAAHAAAVPALPPERAPTLVPSEVLAVATPSAEELGSTPEPSRSGARPAVDPRVSSEAIPASAPPPPPGSTAALVWGTPTIERLPPPPPRVSGYVPIPAGEVGDHRGALIRVVTRNGKRVEGRLVRVDANDLVLRVRRSGGSAELHIPRGEIRAAELRRHTLSE